VGHTSLISLQKVETILRLFTYFLLRTCNRWIHR